MKLSWINHSIKSNSIFKALHFRQKKKQLQSIWIFTDRNGQTHWKLNKKQCFFFSNQIQNPKQIDDYGSIYKLSNTISTINWIESNRRYLINYVFNWKLIDKWRILFASLLFDVKLQLNKNESSNLDCTRKRNVIRSYRRFVVSIRRTEHWHRSQMGRYIHL